MRKGRKKKKGKGALPSEPAKRRGGGGKVLLHISERKPGDLVRVGEKKKKSC